jgi:glyoxylase-like metal-dependent hydrolase (beta-lactamase superfamily II)
MGTDAPHTASRQPPHPHEIRPKCVIEGFPLGPFETNCYLVYVPGSEGETRGRGCWVVDASFEPGPMIERVRELGLSPRALVLTHAHVDHIAGVDEVLAAFPGTPVAIHSAEREWLSNPALNLSIGMGMPVTAHGPDRLLEDGGELELDGSRWKVLHTPGHSPGGVTLYNDAQRAALVGDALFAGSIGRTDFPGCDHNTLIASIRSKLYTLPEETVIYPGHGPASTIGREKRSNPFVRG